MKITSQSKIYLALGILMIATSFLSFFAGVRFERFHTRFEGSQRFYQRGMMQKNRMHNRNFRYKNQAGYGQIDRFGNIPATPSATASPSAVLKSK